MNFEKNKLTDVEAVELLKENEILKQQKEYYKTEYYLISSQLQRKNKEISALKKELTILNRKFNESK